MIDMEYLFIVMGFVIVYAVGFLQGKYTQNETMAIITIIACLFFAMFNVYYKSER